MREKIINYLTVQAMLDPEFDAPLMQRVRCAFIIAEKQYRAMSSDELISLWHKIVEREQINDDDQVSQGNWD